MIITPLLIAALLAVTGSDAPAGTPHLRLVAATPETLGLAVHLVLLDGKTESGQLADIFADQILLQAEDSSLKKIPIENLLSLAPVAAPNPPAENVSIWVELVDGSKFVGNSFAQSNAEATIELRGRTVRVPTNLIRTVRFSKPGESGSVAWPAKVGADAVNDLLAVRKKDSIDFDEGVIKSVDANHVIFQIDGESVPVSRTKVDGLIFFHKSSDTLPEPACIVEVADGSRFKAKEVSLDHGMLLELQTVAGQRFNMPTSEISRIDFSIGKVVYLSDLEPESVRWTPYLDFHKATAALQQFYAPRRDEGREHRPLLVGGKTYAKGWALYSRTEMTFRLPTGAKKFKALAGIDDSVRETGGVRLEISADGKKLFDKAISGSEEPADIDLDIAGAKRLTILVDYGAGLDAGDYLNLADARILK